MILNSLYASFLAGLLAAGLAACQAGSGPRQPNPSPSPVVSPTPSASASASALQNPVIHTGCDSGFIICPAGEPCALPSCASPPMALAQEAPLFIEEARHDELKSRFGLFSVSRAEDHLGGLMPQLPLAKGFKAPCDAGQGLYRSGGRLNACVVYIVQTGPDAYALIDSPAQASSRFAPVDSREEAVSFVSLLTGHDPRYSLGLEPGWRYFSRTIEPTRVEATNEGYLLSLFDYQIFGCGPHPHFEVSYSLARSGELRETGRRKLYEDPDQDGLCVD